MDENQLIDLLAMAGVLAMLALPILSISLAITVRIAWGQARDRHAAEHEADRLQRRLADVEALRFAGMKPPAEKPTRCVLPDTGWRCTRDPGHDGPCAAVPALTRPVHGGYPDDGGYDWVDEYGRERG